MTDNIPPDSVGESAVPPPPPPGSPAPPSPPAAGPAPVQPPKRKLDPLFFILGLMAPWVLNSLAGGIGAGLLSVVGPDGFAGGVTFYALSVLLPLLILIGCLVLFIVGCTRGNERLRSFGLGGLIAYAATLLLGLLAFGSCLVLGGV